MIIYTSGVVGHSSSIPLWLYQVQKLNIIYLSFLSRHGNSSPKTVWKTWNYFYLKKEGASDQSKSLWKIRMQLIQDLVLGIPKEQDICRRCYKQQTHSGLDFQWSLK
jgi:hypothetical protein